MKEEPKPIPVAIQRLIEEVQAGATLYCGTKGGGKSYNRVYSRHNRS